MRLPSTLYLASLDCVEEKRVVSNAVVCQGGQEACVGYTRRFSLGLLHGVVQTFSSCCLIHLFPFL